jgi:hypothetical protein
MSSVCDSDAVGGMEMVICIEDSLDGRVTNVNGTGGSKDDVTAGNDIRTKEDGEKDAAGYTGVHHFSMYDGNDCGEISVTLPTTKLNGINGKGNTSNSSNRIRTASDTWTAEETEDDCIVDFLDKNNGKVHLSFHTFEPTTSAVLQMFGLGNGRSVSVGLVCMRACVWRDIIASSSDLQL